MPDYTTFPMPEPVAHAEPRPDREPERRNLPPIPERPALAPEPIDRTNCNPDALATLERVEADARRMDRIGAVKVNVVGVNETGKVPPGAHDGGFYDEPRRTGDEHHYFPIEINGEVRWQQGPGVHCKGASFASSPAHATVAREISEQRAELAYQLNVLGEGIGGSVELVAELVDMTPMQVARQKARRR